MAKIGINQITFVLVLYFFGSREPALRYNLLKLSYGEVLKGFPMRSGLLLLA